jgi:hypothetical protein
MGRFRPGGSCREWDSKYLFPLASLPLLASACGLPSMVVSGEPDFPPVCSASQGTWHPEGEVQEEAVLPGGICLGCYLLLAEAMT